MYVCKDFDFGLLLGTEAPVTSPNSVYLSFLLLFVQGLLLHCTSISRASSDLLRPLMHLSKGFIP